MPSLPPGLNDWLPTGAVIGFGGWLFTLLRADLKASEARQQEALKAMMSLLREDLKASEERQQEALKAMVSLLREDLKASEARQREDVQALRKDVNDLPMKIAELLRKAPH